MDLGAHLGGVELRQKNGKKWRAAQSICEPSGNRSVTSVELDGQTTH